MSIVTRIRGADSTLRGQAWDRPESWQWQPTLTAHDPNPPITIDAAAGGDADFTATDAGAGADALGGRDVALAESGAGVDALGGLGYGLEDAGAGTDASQLVADIDFIATDAAVGGDLLGGRDATLDDTAAGLDLVALFERILDDLASGADASALTADIDFILTETGSSVDTAFLTVLPDGSAPLGPYEGGPPGSMIGVSAPRLTPVRCSVHEPGLCRRVMGRDGELYCVVANPVAKSLYENLLDEYGAVEGNKTYLAMRHNRQGPFAPKAKYDATKKRVPAGRSRALNGGRRWE